MEKIRFSCTLPAGEMCAIPSVRSAVKNFTGMGKMGFVTLERVATPSNESQIVWVSQHNGRVVAMLPAFKGETVASETILAPRTPIRGGELLYHQDYFYLTNVNKRGEMEIKALTLFADEDTVRRACALVDLDVAEVNLIQMYAEDSQKFVASAWLIESTDGKQTLIYVDLRDRLALGELDYEKVVYRVAAPGRSFTANETWYMLHKDDAGRLYLTRNEVFHKA